MPLVRTPDGRFIESSHAIKVVPDGTVLKTKRGTGKLIVTDMVPVVTPTVIYCTQRVHDALIDQMTAEDAKRRGGLN